MNLNLYPVLDLRASKEPAIRTRRGVALPRCATGAAGGVPAAVVSAARSQRLDFRFIEQYHAAIAATAERYGLDTYPNQLEIITAEQMMDAYSSVGMPVNYRHWSYGKEFLATGAATGAAIWGWPTRSSSMPIPASAI